MNFNKSIISGSRVRLLLLNLIFALVIASCSKTSDPTATGTFEITTTTPGGLVSITATASDGSNYQIIPDPSTGVFVSPSLANGLYTISFTVTESYKVPAPVTVTVVAGNKTLLTVDPLVRDPVLKGIINWTIDGVAYSTKQVEGGVTSELVSIAGLAPIGPGQDKTQKINLVIPSSWQQKPVFKGVGVYDLGTQDYPYGHYSISSSDILAVPMRYVTPTAGPRVGSISITRYDPKKFVITGTFEYVASAQSNATGTVSITQGSFDLTF